MSLGSGESRITSGKEGTSWRRGDVKVDKGFIFEREILLSSLRSEGIVNRPYSSSVTLGIPLCVSVLS